ncbi:hypothetical protein CLV52_1688 [Amnibacterium kyonggiense]|uniref:Uncharacterized protein n=1 Tax=Amnibacterium kyonggiense TaxID=595671 RepID=A0A4R7FTA3_9MICO|nr:hypothetical protein CLV52_1688 [Amnibacterium kyonggiense]
MLYRHRQSQNFGPERMITMAWRCSNRHCRNFDPNNHTFGWAVSPQNEN